MKQTLSLTLLRRSARLCAERLQSLPLILGGGSNLLKNKQLSNNLFRLCLRGVSIPHAVGASVLCALLLLAGTLASCEKVTVPGDDDQETRAKGDSIQSGGTTFRVTINSTEWEKSDTISY